jgi:hypothetical protein
MRVIFSGFETAEFLVNCLVADANGRAFGLSGVCGEDGFYLNFLEGRNDFLLAEAGLGQAFDHGRPEAFDGIGSMGGAAGAAELPGDAFFDDVEKLEADGKELGPFTFGSGRDGLGKGFSFLPGNERAETSVEGKGVGEHGRSFGEAFVEFTESLREISVVLDVVRHSGGRMLRF